MAFWLLGAAKSPDTRKMKWPAFVPQAFEAVQKGDRRTMASLIVLHRKKKKGWIDKAQDPEAGHTLLGTAAKNGDLEMVRVLVESGKAKVDQVGSASGGQTPLSLGQAFRPVIDYLLSKGADPLKRPGGGGWSALDNAIIEGNNELVAAYLLKVKNAKALNKKDAGGYTPLRWAMESKNAVAIRLLLARGADPRAALKPKRGG